MLMKYRTIDNNTNLCSSYRQMHVLYEKNHTEAVFHFCSVRYKIEKHSVFVKKREINFQQHNTLHSWKSQNWIFYIYLFHLTILMFTHLISQKKKSVKIINILKNSWFFPCRMYIHEKKNLEIFLLFQCGTCAQFLLLFWKNYWKSFKLIHVYLVGIIAYIR